MVLTWVLGTIVVSEIRMPSHSPNEYIEAKVCNSWKINGRKRESTDDQQDLMVVHIDQAVPLREVMRVTQVTDKCTREVRGTDGRVQQKPVFWNVFSMR